MKRKVSRRAGPRVSYLFRSIDPPFDVPVLVPRYLAESGLAAIPSAPLFSLVPGNSPLSCVARLVD